MESTLRLVKVRQIEFTPVDALVAFIVVTSGVMVLQLVGSRFDAASSLFVSLLICGIGGLAFIQRVALPANKRLVVAAALLGLLVLALRWNPFLYVEGGQDQGIYVSMSAHFARTQGVAITDQVRERLSETEKIDYDKLNNRHDGPSVEVAGRSEGFHQPGIYIADLSRSAYVFQFYPLHPLWMALAAKVPGNDNRVYSLVGFSLLSVLMLSLLAYELADRNPVPAFIAAALLAINPMHVFLSRFPVTENVTVFFSSSAFYYLLKYFKAREAGCQQTWPLVLSAGAWSCLFFTHIAGFLYAPLILAAIVAGVLSAQTVDRMRELARYGLYVVAAYALSVWYGVTWAFPYSYGIYRAHFGTRIGDYVLDHWLLLIVAFAFTCRGLIYLEWRFRTRIKTQWTSLRLDKALVGVLLVAAIGTFVYGVVDGYLFGFTADQSPRVHPSDPNSFGVAAGMHNWAHMASRLRNTGAAGFLHTSVAALTLYVSPFIVLYLLTTGVLRRSFISHFELFLVTVITYFLVMRAGSGSFTFYYYAGRYLGAELVPYILLLAALWLYFVLKDATRPGKIIAGCTLMLALAWEGFALAPQYPGGEMYRLDAGMRPFVQQIRDNDLLILAGVKRPALRTAIGYYYGKHAVVVEQDQVPATIRRYANRWADLYVLSERDNLAGLTYLGAHTLVSDRYERGGRFDVLPARSTATTMRLFLYRVNRPEIMSIEVGDTITFDKQGYGSSLLGSGWSHQEDKGRWTDGPSASLILPFSSSTSPLTLSFSLASFNCVDVNVRVNGTLRTKWSFPGCTGILTKAIQLSPEDLKSGKVTVDFYIPGATSPRDLDPANGDVRKLGIWINNIVVSKGDPGEFARSK